MWDILKENLLKKITDESSSEEEILDATYEEFFAVYEPNIGYYFRHLYNVIKFVDENEFFNEETSKKKKSYINLIHAQLSSNELGLLFYNYRSSQGISKFKPLVEKYALLKDMDSKTLLSSGHRSYYDESAYGESDQMDD